MYISVTKGEIKLKNVEVNSSAVDDLELPVTIKRGTVGQIHIQLSWTKFTSSPIVVTITDIYLVLCPNNANMQANTNDADYKGSNQLMLSAEMERQKNELLQGTSATVSDTSDAGMMTKILNNMIIKIQNVHVRYEQHVDGHPGVHRRALDTHTYTTSIHMHHKFPYIKSNITHINTYII